MNWLKKFWEKVLKNALERLFKDAAMQMVEDLDIGGKIHAMFPSVPVDVAEEIEAYLEKLIKEKIEEAQF